MHAHIGDRIVIKGHHLGQPRRVGEILEVHGAEGSPPYLVHWGDSQTDSLLFPGPDAEVEEPGPQPGHLVG